MGLLCLVAGNYPKYVFVAYFLMSLDICSHWMLTFQSSKMGKGTHKDQTDSNFLTRLYYENRIFMGACCVSCETLYLAVFLMTKLELIEATLGTLIRNHTKL